MIFDYSKYIMYFGLNLIYTNLRKIIMKKLLIKLMPYILPKVTSVSHTTNEPLDWGC